MTKMIYRGFTYTPATPASSKAPASLMYRGVAHNTGLEAAKPATTKQLIYRGVSYLMTARGQVVPQDTPTTSIFGGSALPA